jgi:hypothetical protein
VYVLGHLVPLIVQSSVGQFPIVLFIAQLIAVVLPNLESFNVEAAVFTGKPVSWPSCSCSRTVIWRNFR